MYTSLFNKIDLIIVPLVLLIMMIILIPYRKKQPVEIQKYFFSSFFLRVFGTVSLGGIFQFIYGYGDTFFYYNGAQALRVFFLKDPLQWLRLLFSNPLNGSADNTALLDYIQSFDQYSYYVYQGTENASVSKIASIFNIVCFDSWLGMALFFGMLSFMGCWYIFKTFVHIYPGYHKQFALLCLFLPSLWFWGSGILKDPVCIYALGLVFFNFFVNKNSGFKRIVLICFGSFLLLSIKSYIFYSFAAAASVAVLILYFRQFNILLKIATFIFMGFLLVLMYPIIADAITQSFEDVVKQSETFIRSYSMGGSEGDATILPTFTPTPAGFAKLGLSGLVNVYLRPFPWEARKILYLFLILENMMLYYFLFRKVKTGPIAFHKNYRLLLYFCLVFFLFLGFIIGVTTFNLGTIARYRVPALPFIFAWLFLLKLVARKKKIDKLPMTLTVTP